MIQIPKHIKALQPYKAGKPIEDLAREKSLTKIVKLASNENPLGPSPKAMEAIQRFIPEIYRYTNPSAYKLVNAISKKYNKKPEQIVTGSGSDSLIQFIITAFSDDGDDVISSEGTFIGWYVNAAKYGRNSIRIPLKNYGFNLDYIADSVTPKTKIIYLANPNNPTGSMFTKMEFEKFHKKIPDDVLVILDEAYTAYAEDLPEYPNGLDYDFDNLIVLRTLSKAYGLAGLRLGFAFGPEYLIKELYKVKLPFEPNLLAQEGAIAALNDDEFVERTKTLNKKSLKFMEEKLDELGIEHIKTAANFLLMIFPTADFTELFNEECLSRGLILRHVKSFGIPNGIRMNSGTMEETIFAMNIVSEVYTKVSQKFDLQIQ